MASTGVRHHVALYGTFLAQRLKAALEYRADFLIGVASAVPAHGAGLVAVWVVVGQIPALDGWTLHEVLFMYGLLMMAKSLNDIFADNLWRLGEPYIRNGDFDRFLLRPVNPLFHLLADRFNYHGLGVLLTGVALVAVSVPSLGIAWTVPKLAYLLMSVVSGGAIFVGLNLLTGASAFWIVLSVPVVRTVFELHEFAKFPLSIYPPAVAGLMTWVVPYGFASYYPARYLLGDDPGLRAWLAPVVAAAVLGLGYAVWLRGLRRYQSTGS